MSHIFDRVSIVADVIPIDSPKYLEMEWSFMKGEISAVEHARQLQQQKRQEGVSFMWVKSTVGKPAVLSYWMSSLRGIRM